MLAPILFVADFRHNTNSCVFQKFSDDSEILGLITDDQDAEDIQGMEIVRVDSYKFLRVRLNNKIDWTRHGNTVQKGSEQTLPPDETVSPPEDLL